MVARGSFDDEIRTQLRGRGNVNRGDAQQEARDRAARGRNVRSGKNPNPRTSTAYKEPPPARAKSKSKGGGRKGVPTPKSRPGAPPSGLPSEAPIPTPRPGDAPVVEGSGIEGLITSLLLQRLIAQGAKPGGGMGEVPPGMEEGGRNLSPMYEEQVPPRSVKLQRVPNEIEGELLPPSTTRALTYNPEQAMPPSGAAPSDAPDNFQQFNRFFDQGEIAAMQDAMPGIKKMPGMGGRNPRIGPFPRGVRP